MPEPLRNYQIEDLTFCMMNRRCLLLHDPGGGKTPTVCVMIEYTYKHEHKPSLWVMPKQLLGKNRDEIKRFTNLRDHEIVTVVKPEDLLKPGIVYLMTAARLRLSLELISKTKWGLVLGDEIHLFWKTNGSKQVGALYQLMSHQPDCRWIGMTGTIIDGRLSSVYPSIHVIEPRYYPSYQSFLNQHAISDSFGNVIAWQRPERIAEIIGKHAIRRSFESIYGPEAKVIVTELADMAPEQRAAYKEFESKAILELENSFLEGATGGVYALRCRQLMSCPQIHGLLVGKPTGKDELLDLHLVNHANSKTPVVVFSCFQEEQERIAELGRARGLRVAVLNGTVSGPKRIKIDEDFRAGKIDMISGSPLVASVGYNWGHNDHVVYASVDYMDSTIVQGYRRMIRGRRNKPLLITILEYRDSLDQRMMKIIETKSRLAQSVNPDKEVFSLASVPA